MRAYQRRRLGWSEKDADKPKTIVKPQPESFIYVLQNPAYPGYVKIGHARDPQKRLNTYNVGCPFGQYTFAALIPVHDAPAAEAWAHRMVRRHAVRGEWFQVHADDAVNLLKHMPHRSS